MEMDKAKHSLLTTLGVVYYLSMLQRMVVSLTRQSLLCQTFLILCKFTTDVEPFFILVFVGAVIKRTW